jgi:hypothetical protein
MIEDFYVDCVKQSKTITVGTHGQQVIVNINIDINGYLGSSTQNNVVVAGKSTVESTYKFYTNYFIWSVGDTVIYENAVYEVVAQPKNTAHKDNHCKLILKRLDGVKDEYI